MLIFDHRPEKLPSKVYKYKDPDYNNKKTYKVDEDNYMTRYLIYKQGKKEVPEEVYNKCYEEFSERTKNIELWGKERYTTFAPLTISKNLTLDTYQVLGFKMMILLKRAILNMDMGTGKTAVTIGLWTYFCNKTMLVVCPNNVKQEWVEQFEQFLGVKPIVIKYLEDYKTSEELNLSEEDIAPVYVINYEMFRSQRKKAKKVDILVFDEVHRGAGLTSLTNKTMFDFSMLADRVYGLSGSIVGNHFEDILGIYSVIDPLVFGVDKMVFYRKFTNYVLNEYKQPYVFSYKNWDMFSAKFHSISYTVKLEDVIKMPNRREEFIYCPRDKNYKKLLQEYIFTEEGIDLETGERDTRLFTVDRVLNMTMKLMQLCSGFIKDIEGKWIRLNTHKRDSLKEWFKDKYPSMKNDKRKIVIFYQFDISGNDIEEVMKEHNIIYKRIDGSVSDKNKDKYKTLFKSAEFGDPEGCDVVVINYGTGTEGMNFQRGTCMLFYDQTLEFRKKEQADRRIFRRGQTEDCLYINFVTESSKEVDTFYKLSKIRDFSQFLNEVKKF